MPLLKRHPFVRNPYPEDLKASEEVFFCPLTREIFREYDAFFNRTILLNSLVWSCSVTGRSGLTFEEALESEKHAQESLDSFPESLEKPLAFVVEMTYRGRMDDLVSDVWTFMKDRFFINEEVEVFNKKSRRLARIIGVKYNGSASGEAGGIGPEEKKADKEVTPTVNGTEGTSMEVQKSGKRLKEDLKAPSPSCYTYDIEYMPGEDSDEDEDESMASHEEEVKHSTIFRKKGAVTRGKLKLFIKNACEPYDTRWGLKAHLLREYSVASTDWEEIFTGPRPLFPKTPMAKRASTSGTPKQGKAKAQENCDPEPSTSTSTPDSQKDKSGKGSKEKKPKKLSKAELKRAEEQKKKEEEDKKARKKQDEERIGLLEQARASFGQHPPTVDLSPWDTCPPTRIFTFDEMFALRMAVRKAKQFEKERVQEEKRREKEALLEWKRQRDDLECDDLKPLPVPPALRLPSWISNETFGELLSLLEFFRCFEELLGFSDGLSCGLVGLEDLLQMLVTRQGERNLFLELLTALLEVWGLKQTEEDGDEANMENDQQIESSELEHPLYSDEIRAATRTSEEVRIIHGVSIRKLQLDPLTVTEVLRLYIMAGGYYTGQSTAKFRYHNRGGYRCWDDQCFMFRQKHPQLVHKLKTQSVLNFDPIQRLKILCLIRDQLLTFFAFREHQENNLESFRQLRVQMRTLEKNDEKAEKEAKAAKNELRYIERLKEREEEGPKEAKEEGTTAGDEEIPKRPKPSKKSLKLSKWLQNHFTSEGDSFSLAPTRKGADAEAEMHQLMNDGVEFREMSEAEIGQIRQLQRAKLVSDQEEVAENLLTLNVATGLTFLGRDRAFRRYWYSDCLRTVLMEENDETIGSCGEATPMSRVPDRPDLDDLPLSQFDPDAIDAKLRMENLACSGEEESCLVHGKSRLERPVWSVFVEPDQLNELSRALNERGFREAELADNIRSLRSHLENAIGNHQINPAEDGSGGLFGDYFNFDPMLDSSLPSPSPLPDWGFMLRDLLLETEEKIQLGGLGALDLPDRQAWRDGLAGRRPFDSQLSKLTVGSEETPLLTLDQEEMDAMNGVSQAGLALVQIAQGIHLKFLKDPFVEENKDNAENGPTLVGQRVPTMSFYLWQRSAVEATSFFQVAVHLSSLETCISWKQSKLQARCRICRKKGSSDTTVLCDSCDKAFHIFCARPKLKEVPTENWLCCDCVKIENERRSREEKKRRMEEKRLQENENGSDVSSDLFDDGMSGDEGEEACIECGKTATSRNRAECEECGLIIHSKCAGLKARPKSDWLCVECRGGDSSTDEDLDEYTEKVVTSKTGRVIKKTKSYNEEVLANSNKGKVSRRSSGRNSPINLTNGFGHTNGEKNGRKRKLNSSDQDISEKELRYLSMGLRRKGLGTEEISKCQKVIEETRKQEDAIPFLTPVDRKEVPLYYTFIRNPMDLRTMLNKLKNRQYECVEDVVADASLMFNNCRAFNEDEAEVFKCGTRLEEFMMKQFRANGLLDDSSSSEKRRRSGVSK